MIRPLTLLLAFAAACPAHALVYKQAEALTDPAGAAYPEERVIVTRTAELSGAYGDDVLVVASESLQLHGTFANDVWVLGSDVRVGGQVADHLRVAGNSFTLSGTVSNKLDAVGAALQISDTAVVRGGAWLVGESVVVAGSVEGPLTITAQDVTLAGSVRGPMRIIASDIVVLSSARIEGDIVYNADRDLVLDPTVHLSGTLSRGSPSEDQESAPAPGLGARVASRAVWLAAAMLVGWPLVALFPRFMGRAVRLARSSTLRCCFVGAAAFCLLPMGAILLMVTVVGMPLGLLVLLTYGMLLYLSQFVIALTAGSAILRWRGHQSLARVFLILLLGLLLLYILTALPMVGLACWLATAFLGLGGLLLSLFARDEAAPPPAPVDETPPSAEPPVQ